MDTRGGITAPIPEDELHALVDGRVEGEAATALERRLAANPAAQATVGAWRAQRESLRSLYADVKAQPAPASLVAAAERAAQAHGQASQWWRWGGIAASVLLAFGLGWVSGQWRIGAEGAAMARLEPARQFAQQAAVAHAVFQPEVRHPVEVAAAQQEHLVQWLSKRLGRPLKVPVLSAQGYDLVGGRLLPGDDGARAQFMYQNGAGQRITLYVGAVKAGAAGVDTRETAFRFLSDGPVPGFYWVDQGFGYAITGPLPRAALQDLATVVYKQL
ncbi:MAG: putative transrane transcriptional regulator [Ramlibacter sp.]|nr:putative transrane transcriptional regulator [Ramlibacter sp.]